jgi:hypothetical protein
LDGIWNGQAWLEGRAAVGRLLRGAPLVRFEAPPEASPVAAVALARPARPVAAWTRAEATTGFPTAGARDVVAAYTCEHLHNDD